MVERDDKFKSHWYTPIFYIFQPLSFSSYLIPCDVLALLHCVSSKGGREVVTADETLEEFWKIKKLVVFLSLKVFPYIKEDRPAVSQRRNSSISYHFCLWGILWLQTL